MSESGCEGCDNACNGELTKYLNGDMEKISKSRRIFRMRKNQILMTVGQPLTGWYCLRKGRLRIYRVSHNGKEQTYRIVKPGEWIGYREMLESSESMFNAVSIQESEVCFIPQSLWPGVMKNPEFVMALVNSLSGELKRQEELVFALGTKKLHSRLAELLIGLAENESNETLSLTREIMSTMLGSTTESIVRALTDFKDRNWVEVEKNKIRLTNLKALKEMAQMDQI